MPELITWSPLAELDLLNILDYLDQKWEKKVATNFIEALANTNTIYCRVVSTYI